MCGLSPGAQNRAVFHWRRIDTVHSYRHRPSLLREPLLHFVVLGAALFALHAWWVDSGAAINRATTAAIRVRCMVTSPFDDGVQNWSMRCSVQHMATPPMA